MVSKWSPPQDRLDSSKKPTPSTDGGAAKKDPPVSTTPTTANQTFPVQPKKKEGLGRFHVVGIGASAGGLEAFKRLLAQLPVDSGMAYVLIQHLDPTHESHLSEILSRVTRIPVHEVTKKVRLKPNHIYVIPAEMDLDILDGSLSLIPRTNILGMHMPIDSFFRSLAKIQQGGSIAIVLSGTGSDGTLGVQDIHGSGGIVSVQDPASAKFDGMPRSAIATGCAQFILSPEGIAEELAKIGKRPYVPGESLADQEIPLPSIERETDTIFGLLRTKTGVDFGSYKRATLNRRIHRRMQLKGIEHLPDYVSFLKTNPAEIDDLYNDILIKVTRFFRDTETFEVLKNQVFGPMIQNKQAKAPIRVWVPACCTGEEAYSLAIALLEFLGDAASQTPLQIFGTDISGQAIERARAGLYPKNIEADVSPERLRRFFSESNGAYQINKSLRELCVFAKQNIVKDPPFSRVDLISCRNVLIYLSADLQKRIMPTFHFALNPQGRLLLGSSETIGAFTDLFAVEDRHHRIFAKNTLVRSRLALDFTPEPYGGEVPAEKAANAAPQVRPRPTVHKEFDRALLDRYAPVGVVVNESMDVLQFRGDTTPYLLHPSGDVTFNLFRLLREGIIVGVNNAIQEARRTNRPVERSGLTILYEGGIKHFSLEVLPIKIPLSSERCWGVMFREVLPRAEDKKEISEKTAPDKQESDEHQWQQEMASAKTYLESVIEEKEAAFEELQSANEEILSSNEEFQSVNEEMQTAKEELQSTNEELTTVNDELRHSNAETIKLVDDLNNILDSVNIPIVMVGNDLRIRRFTSEAGHVLHLLSTDVGRPLRDFNTSLDLMALEKFVLDSIDTVSTKEQRITNGEKLWYSVRIRPYKTADGKIDGAVITLIDIESMKRTEEKILKARDAAENILNTVREPLVVLDSALRVRKASNSFYRMFKVEPEEVENRYFYDLGIGQWSNPILRRRLEEVLAEKGPLSDFPVEHQFPGVEQRSMVINASRIFSQDAGEDLVLVAIVDITDHKRAEEALAVKAVELSRSNKDLEDFAHIVSHDLQMPLRKIISFGDLLKTNMESPVKVNDYLSRIQNGAVKMGELISSLLTFSRATASKKTESVDVGAVVKEVISELETEITRSEATVTFENLPIIQANRPQISQLLINLIGNALKYGGTEPPVIHVSAKQEGQVWVCSVRDNGMGIDKENALRIFDLFQRVPIEGKPGTGVGLTICKKIVENYGGNIWVDSELGKGSTFYFTFPAPFGPIRAEKG